MTITRSQTTDLYLDRAVAAPAEQLRAAVTDVGGWWSSAFERSGDEFTVYFDQNWTRVRVDGERWTVVAQDTPALPIPDEWVGDTLTLTVEDAGDTTSVLHFTHHGLLAEECADDCRQGWRHYIGSLVALAETGQGYPWSPGRPTIG